MQHPDPVIRRCQRVLAMVHELHKRGFQRLRIVPGESPSGAYWRCQITPVTNILCTHGAMAKEHERLSVSYTSGMDTEYFGWKDVRQDTARKLAAKFIERFPEITASALGRDWSYAGWYVEMLGHAEQGHLPLSYADWYEPVSAHWLPTMRAIESGLPMPPPGEAESD